MNALTKLTVVATATALMFSGCGGGSGTSTPTVPSQTAQSAPNRAVVGTATLTLAFPNVVTAASVSRSPQYVNPIVDIGGPCPNHNLLDIYVDGTLQPALDNGPEAPHSLCVTATSNGTQTATLPLYSSNSNQIVAVEWDSSDTNVLALGEQDQGLFSPGTPVSVSLTMLMNAQFIGITNLTFSDSQKMIAQAYGHTDFACPGSAAQVGLYPTDALGTFVPTAGYAGTSTVTATGNPVAGTTSFSQTSIPGVYNVGWDGSCDDLNLTATAANPAYVIFNDVNNQDNAVYPGIDFLYYNESAFPWFAAQLNHATVNGTVVVHNSTN
jgi:hypothetical protein